MTKTFLKIYSNNKSSFNKFHDAYGELNLFLVQI